MRRDVKRRVGTYGMIAFGAVLGIVSYFWLATPWCNDSIACSNPRIEWAAGLFVLSVLVAFSSAAYYVIVRDRRE